MSASRGVDDGVRTLRLHARFFAASARLPPPRSSRQRIPFVPLLDGVAVTSDGGLAASGAVYLKNPDP